MIRTAVRRDILIRAAEGLSAKTRSIDDYQLDDLVNHVTAYMGGTWWEREELVRATARYLGFRRTGDRIVKAFKSAINAAIRRNLLEYEGSRVRKK